MVRRAFYGIAGLIIMSGWFSSALFAASSEPESKIREKAEEISARRQKALELMGSGMMILFSNEPKYFSNDVFYPFRQENNLYYLTGINQAGITLVLLPENYDQREILFLPRRDPSREIWTGHMLSPEEASRISNISHVWDADEFEPFIEAVLHGNRYDKRTPDDERDYRSLFNAAARDSANVRLLEGRGAERIKEFALSHAFKNSLSRFSGVHAKDAMPLFTQLRLVKSPYEISLLRRAVDITCEAHRLVMAAAAKRTAPGMNESEMDGIILATYRRHGAHWGFPSIVASGPNATTLHYEDNSRAILHDNELVLLDIGAAVDHYSADVTRTIPISGTFTPEQRAVYEIVLQAQKTAIQAVGPGMTIRKIHNIARDVLRNGLLDLRLITDVESDQYRMWFMHGTSHWIGLDVHDVGGRDTPFEPGMVLTVEPGIYIRDDALDYLEDTPANKKLIESIRPAFEAYKNIGIRIEDDILVTESGFEILSESAPRTVDDIEAYMSKTRNE